MFIRKGQKINLRQCKDNDDGYIVDDYGKEYYKKVFISMEDSLNEMGLVLVNDPVVDVERQFFNFRFEIYKEKNKSYLQFCK
jgi:hypothetical protein